jgi:uncharacterized protein YjbJ (UPF0337 family)
MGAVDNSKNATQRARGKVKEAAGKATGNERLRRRGKIDQAKAKVKQTAEKIKDALRK